ncbi:amidohydrolase family protein [Sphingomonas colocasiae]|uniref:Amidohydrolase family protein n=1 Tax=Sphingomonas colocasiae TaxID=1848973 RepID=A0ABS7PSZ8_9SPHN|nr:amidohydrolase family protein [Sphingomonas colocasiae]MBY8824472.1 amidohydrolase family protein [Sphingomonas colocasiae]
MKQHLRALCLGASLSLLALSTSAPAQPAEPYDVVIAGGRVIDPESGLDGIRQIGIRDGRIAVVTTEPLRGRTTIDAKGLVVGPGFVDVHSHAQTIPAAWIQAFDGVTTALELEGGTWPVASTYDAIAKEGRPINYGFSVNWLAARTDMGLPRTAPASDEDVVRVVARVEQGLNEGGLGVGMLAGYAPDTGRQEYLDVARLAAKRDVPTFTHVRTKNTREPKGAVEGFSEVIAVAAATGAHMHICHINSSALRAIPSIAAMIETARANGVSISSEAYPWGAGSTKIDAPFLHPDNLPQINIKSSSIVYLKTGERPATNARLAELQKSDPEGQVVIHYLDETIPAERRFIDDAVMVKDSMIASDAVPYEIDGKIFDKPQWPLPAKAVSHPRTASTFTATIAYYVREKRMFSLNEMFRRASLLPARLMESVAPGMRDKGRIRPGADADIIVFDPETVAGQASYEDTTKPARGMANVLVGGQFVIRDGKLITTARPGRPIRGATR